MGKVKPSSILTTINLGPILLPARHENNNGVLQTLQVSVQQDSWPDLNNNCDSSNFDCCFSTRVSNVRQTVPLLHHPPDKFWNLMQSNKTEQASSVEENN